VLTLLVSPSKKILSLLAQGALSKIKIHQSLAVEQFVQSRLADLIASGMVRDEGRLVLTVEGRVSYSLACLFEALIGRGKGG
jgi:hypothetical protein